MVWPSPLRVPRNFHLDILDLIGLLFGLQFLVGRRHLGANVAGDGLQWA